MYIRDENLDETKVVVGSIHISYTSPGQYTYKPFFIILLRFLGK